MKKLIPITVFGVIMAFLSHKYSEYDPINCKYGRKERMFYTLMSIAMCLFVGLRVGYNDTVTYIDIYLRVIDDFADTGRNLLEGIKWTNLGDNPAFFFLMRVMARLKFSTQSFLMVFSFFTVGVNLWFFRKYSCNLWMSVLLFITFAGFTFNLAAIKQCVAMAFCLIATDRAIEKKYIQFLIFVLLGSLFHPYALMYLIVPFLFFRPWSQYTVLMLLVFGLAGFGLQSMLGTLLDVTDMLGEHYDASSFTGEGVNPVRLLVTAVPSMIALLTSQKIAEKDERDQYVIVNLTMLNAEIMFVALFGTANYFARLANYFLPFQAVSIPWLLKHFDYHGRKTMILLATLGYVAFFIYSQAIHESFDAGFRSVTLWEYLQTLFIGGAPA